MHMFAHVSPEENGKGQWKEESKESHQLPPSDSYLSTWFSTMHTTGILVETYPSLMQKPAGVDV